MKILHVSDLHLDSPFVGIGKKDSHLQDKLINAPYKAFNRCVELAITEKIDLMIVSGDIYNSEHQTITAQHYFLTKLEELNTHKLPIILCHGNHDYIRNEQILNTYPENVRVFSSERVDYFDFHFETEETLRVYGFSYFNKWIKDNKIDEYPVNNKQTDYTIGVLHGSVRGSNESSNNYAPFTLEELKLRNYDYWALGHIHKPERLLEYPLIQYPGTIQGRNPNEAGDKGCYIIEFKQGKITSNKFCSLSSIIWETAEVELQSDFQATDIVKHIQKIINNFKMDGLSYKRSYIIDIVITNSQLLTEDLYRQISAGELQEAIQGYNSDEVFVVVNRIKLEVDKYYNVFDFDQGLKESFNIITHNYLINQPEEKVLKDLFEHPILAKHFSFNQSTEFIEEVFEKGKETIIYSAGLELVGDADDN